MGHQQKRRIVGAVGQGQELLPERASRREGTLLEIKPQQTPEHGEQLQGLAHRRPFKPLGKRLRTVLAEKLLRTLGHWEQTYDALLRFDDSPCPIG